MLTWRGDPSRVSWVKKSRLQHNCPAISAGEKYSTHAAASRIPNGNPSTRRQILRMAAAFSTFNENPGRACFAFWTNSCIESKSSKFRGLSAGGRSNPWRWYRVSHSRFSFSRDVTSALTCVPTVNISRTRTASSSKCSKLSKTSKIFLLLRWSRTACWRSPFGDNWTPSFSAKDGRNSSTVLNCARGINTTPSWNWSRSLLASSSARRVLPTPPTPKMVTNRIVKSLNNSRTLSNSAIRPIKGVTLTGKCLLDERWRGGKSALILQMIAAKLLHFRRNNATDNCHEFSPRGNPAISRNRSMGGFWKHSLFHCFPFYKPADKNSRIFLLTSSGWSLFSIWLALGISSAWMSGINEVARSSAFFGSYMISWSPISNRIGTIICLNSSSVNTGRMNDRWRMFVIPIIICSKTGSSKE